eukprot:g5568.t1
MFTLPSLEWVAMHHVELTIVPDATSMTKLHYFNLKDNNLTSEVPSFKGLTRLKSVSLAENSLRGGRADMFDGCQALETVDMSNNRFIDSSLFHFAGCTKLTAILLGGNRITGAVPGTWSKLTSVFEVNLANNLIGGPRKSVLSPLQGMASLEFLDLSRNLFEYEFDKSDCASSSLACRVEMWLLESFPKSVKILDLSYNNFTSPDDQPTRFERGYLTSIDEPVVVGKEYHIVGADFLLHYVSVDQAGFHFNRSVAACDPCPAGLAIDGADGGRYFWRDGRCKKCPTSMAPTLLLLFAIVFLIVSIAYWAMETHLHHQHVVLTAIGTVLVHTLQVVVIVSERVPWPKAIEDVLDFLHKLALRLDLASPECIAWAVCEDGHLTTNEDIKCWKLIENNQLSAWGELLLTGIAAAPFLHVFVPINIYRAISGRPIGCCFVSNKQARNTMACISAPYKLRWQRRWVLFDMLYKTLLVWARAIGSFEQRSQTMVLLILVCAYHVALCVVQPFKLDVINSQNGALFSIFLICGAAQMGLLAGTLTYLKGPAGESASAFEKSSMEVIVMLTLIAWLSTIAAVVLWRIVTLVRDYLKRGQMSAVELMAREASDNQFQSKMLKFKVAREQAHVRRIRNRKFAVVAPFLLMLMGMLTAAYASESRSSHQAAAAVFMLGGALAMIVRAHFFFEWLGAIFESQQRLEDGASVAFMMQSATWRPGDEHWVQRAKGEEAEQYDENDHRHHWRRGKVEKVEKVPGGGGRSMLQVRLVDDNSLATVHRAPGLIELPSSAKGFLHRGQEWLRRIPMSHITEKVLGGKAGSPELFQLSEPCDPRQIDYFISHSWHDDDDEKFRKLDVFAAEFKRKHGREPTFWLDKCCLDQENITQGLQVLAVFLMACKSVIVLGGETYTKRLWCMWELYVYFAFRPQARIDVLSLDGDDSGRLEDELRYFTVANAFCFDPNEEKRIMDAIAAGRGGTAAFDKIINELGSRVQDVEDGSAATRRQSVRGVMPLAGQDGTLLQNQQGRDGMRAAAKAQQAMKLMMSINPEERAKGAEIFQRFQTQMLASLSGSTDEEESKTPDARQGNTTERSVGSSPQEHAFTPPKDLDSVAAAQEQLLGVENDLMTRPPRQPMTMEQRGIVAECFTTIRGVLDSLVVDADKKLLRTVAAEEGGLHRNAYSACHDIVRTDAGYEGLLRDAREAQERFPGAEAGGRRTCVQGVNALNLLYSHARAAQPLFQRQMRAVVAQFESLPLGKHGQPRVKLSPGPLKHLYRCMEKMCLKEGTHRYEAESVCDMVRCIVECADCGLMSRVLAAIIDCRELVVMRVKDRANHLTSMMWQDVMVNVALADDANTHVCEIQIVHHKMLVARSEL